VDTVTVATPESYPVHVGRGLLPRLGEWARPLGPGRAGLLCDDGVPFSLYDRCARSLEAEGFFLARVTVRAGEASKRLSQAERVLGDLVAAGLERNSPIFVVGGGMMTDLGGFCAAVLHRGVPLVLVPTTLLAQLDAAVGGKCGVNLDAGKNLIGSFHQPRLVVADLDALATLPLRHVRNGLGEAMKCGLVADATLLDRIELTAPALLAGDPEALHAIVLGAIRAKAGIVARDEREQGDRIKLNFGHTVGHALEASQSDLLHGEAVALGMVAALRIGVRLKKTPADLEARAIGVLTSLGLPTDLDRYVTDQSLAPAAFDKKRLSGKIRFVCLRAPAQTEVLTLTPQDLLRNLRP
jgi:3-dehydroquinate synthase